MLCKQGDPSSNLRTPVKKSDVVACKSVSPALREVEWSQKDYWVLLATCFQEISQKVVEQELWQPPLVLLYESMHLHAYYNIYVHVYTHARAYTHIPQLFVKIVSDGSDG